MGVMSTANININNDLETGLTQAVAYSYTKPTTDEERKRVWTPEHPFAHALQPLEYYQELFHAMYGLKKLGSYATNAYMTSNGREITVHPRLCKQNPIYVDHEEHFMVANSRIEGAGSGLYTLLPIEEDKAIGVYSGDELNEEQKTIRYPRNTARWLIDLDYDHYVDGAASMSLIKFANHASKKSDANAYMTYDAVLYASKDIPWYTEILWSYVDQYNFA